MGVNFIQLLPIMPSFADTARFTLSEITDTYITTSVVGIVNVVIN